MEDDGPTSEIVKYKAKRIRITSVVKVDSLCDVMEFCKPKRGDN
ncbi:unnamed protein product [Hapterophycus canaliculatus]